MFDHVMLKLPKVLFYSLFYCRDTEMGADDRVLAMAPEAAVFVAVLGMLLLGLVQSSLPASTARRLLHVGTSGLVLAAGEMGYRDTIVVTAAAMLLGHLPFVPLGWLWRRFDPGSGDGGKG